MTTGTSGIFFVTWRSTSRPVRPGIRRSVTMTSPPSASMRANPSRGSAKGNTSKPSRRSAATTLWRLSGSSSKTRHAPSPSLAPPLGQRQRQAAGKHRPELLLEQERDGHRGPLPLPAADVDRASVLLNDLADDREPQAAAVLPGGEEEAEDIA